MMMPVFGDKLGERTQINKGFQINHIIPSWYTTVRATAMHAVHVQLQFSQ